MHLKHRDIQLDVIHATWWGCVIGSGTSFFIACALVAYFFGGEIIIGTLVLIPKFVISTVFTMIVAYPITLGIAYLLPKIGNKYGKINEVVLGCIGAFLGLLIAILITESFGFRDAIKDNSPQSIGWRPLFQALYLYIFVLGTTSGASVAVCYQRFHTARAAQSDTDLNL